MKMRLFVCIALAMMVAGALTLSSRLALAQDDPAKGRGQQTDADRPRSEDPSTDADKALRAYDERMDRNLDKCRRDLDQMKKELHELIDLRVSMAMSVAELRARNATPGGPIGRSGDDEGATRSAGAGGQGRGAGGVNASDMARELQQLHNQLRAEIEQQQNQVAQLASQLRALKGQGHQAQPGQQAASARPGQPGQGGQARGQESDKDRRESEKGGGRDTGKSG
jgi:chorismate mutase